MIVILPRELKEDRSCKTSTQNGTMLQVQPAELVTRPGVVDAAIVSSSSAVECYGSDYKSTFQFTFSEIKKKGQQQLFR